MVATEVSTYAPRGGGVSKSLVMPTECASIDAIDGVIVLSQTGSVVLAGGRRAPGAHEGRARLPQLALVHTSIRYHGLPITVMGRPDTGLLVVADFDTPAARAIGLITAHRRHGEIVYRVVGHSEDLTSVTAAAAAVVAERTGSSR